MGMSASQARLLTLTARLSDLELQAQTISNDKIRLSMQSEQASMDYSDALNKSKLTVSSGSTTVDATAYNLTSYNAVSSTDKQRFIEDAEGRVLVTTTVGKAYDNALNAAKTRQAGYTDKNAYLDATVGYHNEDSAKLAGVTYDANKLAVGENTWSGVEDFMNSLGYTSDNTKTTGTPKYDKGALTYYTNVMNQIAQNGYNAPGDDNMKNSDWLYQEFANGNLHLYTDEDGNKTWENVSWSSGDASLNTKTDDTMTAKAEADYQAKMAQIQTKDKKFDLELQQIDTQHSAIQTEIDSVKKVIDKNIERSFKIFSA
jgi:hypothetical protein